LLELPRAMTPTELAGGFALSGTMSLPGRIEAGFIRRIALLPPPTQCLLLVASAESVGDPIVVWRAASSLGIAGDAATPATEAGLVEFGGRVVFRHPLVRSAAYRRATAAERHDAHRALAAATDANVDPDRRAWHRAQATPAPDEDVAVELERAASRARGRGGLAAAAAFLDRSVALTTDPARRGERALAAAEAKHQAGAHEAALALVARAETGPLDKVQRARIEMLRGQIAFGSSHGGDAPSLLLAAARQLDSLDAALARDTYLDALTAALFVGRLRGAVGVLEVAESARAAPASLARPPDLLLDGFAVVITEGFATGAPLLKRAVEAFRTEDIPAPQAVRWLWHATHAAHDLWDDESWDLLCTRHIQLARQVGALGILPIALSARIGLHLFAGELTLAASLVEELAAVTEATGSGLPPYGALALAAWQGREAKASELIRAVRSELVPRGEGMGLTLVDHAAAVLYNGLGRYEEACEAARRGAEHPHELAFSAWSLVQLVEAAARSDQLALARDALERLAEMTGPSGTSWALGIEARSRALVSDREEAEGLYREAIDHLGRTRLPLELARAHLLYGEWLRRENRRVDARQQLRTAHESFLAMGTEAFGERARRELAATGETVRKRTVNTSLQLTAQEAQIARLAAEGRTNPEIGAELFISARTVEWHLRKVYPKLGITSRRELRRALPDGRLSGAPA
jgi:DNA-binding CsgD family transcriptional regulator